MGEHNKSNAPGIVTSADRRKAVAEKAHAAFARGIDQGLATLGNKMSRGHTVSSRDVGYAVLSCVLNLRRLDEILAVHARLDERLAKGLRDLAEYVDALEEWHKAACRGTPASVSLPPGPRPAPPDLSDLAPPPPQATPSAEHVADPSSVVGVVAAPDGDK